MITALHISSIELLREPVHPSSPLPHLNPPQVTVLVTVMLQIIKSS